MRNLLLRIEDPPFKFRSALNYNDIISHKEPALFLEDLITEYHMLLNEYEDIEEIRGGKYTKDIHFRTYISNLKKRIREICNRPLCKCGLPCETKFYDGSRLFMCPKNDWKDYEFTHENYKVGKSCKFWIKCNFSVDYSQDYINIQRKYDSILSKISENGTICKICKCDVEDRVYTKDICRRCLQNEYEEIKNIPLKDECFIEDDG